MAGLYGEIYNFKDLRQELEARGATFASQSDTEVIIALYEMDGPAAVARLNGMFAYALWDQRRCELHLARDRLGINPSITRGAMTPYCSPQS